MKIIIKGEPKEIAALTLAVQKRNKHVNLDDVIDYLADSLEVACDTLSDNKS